MVFKGKEIEKGTKPELICVCVSLNVFMQGVPRRLHTSCLPSLLSYKFLKEIYAAFKIIQYTFDCHSGAASGVEQ